MANGAEMEQRSEVEAVLGAQSGLAGGAFSIQEILRNSGDSKKRRRDTEPPRNQPFPSHILGPVPHFPLFHSFNPFLPFLPFASAPRPCQPAPTLHKKVENSNKKRKSKLIKNNIARPLYNIE